MEWFETLKGTVKKTAGKAYEKSSQLVEITKITYKISEAETSIDKSYQELGMKVYNDYKSGIEVAEDVKSVCDLIDNKYFEITTLKNQIDEIKEVQKCKACGAKNSAESKFCSTCGEKLDIH